MGTAQSACVTPTKKLVIQKICPEFQTSNRDKIEAHFIFNKHTKTTIYEAGGIIDKLEIPYEPIINQIADIIFAYSELQINFDSIKIELYIASRKPVSNYPFGVTPSKINADRYGVATMEFVASGPALCFGLVNV